MKKKIYFGLIAILIVLPLVFGWERPPGEPPCPWWSPKPITSSDYISAICGSGDPVYQQWCTYFNAHPNEVPSTVLGEKPACHNVIPEFSSTAALIALMGAGLGFLLLRKR